MQTDGERMVLYVRGFITERVFISFVFIFVINKSRKTNNMDGGTISGYFSGVLVQKIINQKSDL